MTDSPLPERLILKFSPLPQDAWSEERDLATDAQVLRIVRDWGEHLARAIRIADRLAAEGWRLTLVSDVVLAEKRADRAELAALALELRDDLRALTASAETGSHQGATYLALDEDRLRPTGADEFRALVDP